MSAAMKVLVNPIIVLKHILKLIEMVLKYENDFKISEFYRSRTFVKVEKSGAFSEQFQIFWKMLAGRAPALRVSRAVTRLTVHRSLPYRNSS